MVKKIGIIGAMDEEIQHLLAAMSERSDHLIYGFTFYEGMIGQQSVVIVRSGIGKVNASVTAVLLVEKFEVDFVMNTGTAGGLDEGLAVGDVVIAQALVHHDVDVTGFGYQVGQMAGMPEVYYPDPQGIQALRQAARTLEIEPVVGLIASGDQFVNDPEEVAEIRGNFPTVRAVEMESAAIAQALYLLRIPFVIVRCISDAGDQKATLSFDEFLVLAGSVSAQIVLTFIDQVSE